MWIKTNHIQEEHIFIYVTKTTDFWGNIFTLVEGTGPCNYYVDEKSHSKDVTPSIPWSGQFIEHR
jgi:hypothetical protein